MLAYVFWHSPSPGIDSREYSRRLRAFHRHLNEIPPAGFVASHTWHIGSVPWLEDAGTHEDWYLLQDASCLDALAEAAISHRIRSLHDSVAGLAASGIAGLYKPARAEHARAEGDCASWFSKPSGTTYAEFYRYLDEQVPSIAGRLWQRFLTLGPTPEFCLAESDGVDLPAEYAPLVVSRHS
jgi:hypothetical protein